VISSARSSHLKNFAARIATAVLATVIICPMLRAQSTDSGQPTQPSTSSGPELNPNLQPPVVAPTSTASPDTQSAADSSTSGEDSNPRPLATNLETGLPLRTVMSPLHWGRLSLLSFTAFEGYNTNFQLQPTGSSTQLTAFQFLAIYSVQRAKTSFSLQYRPYVFFTQHTTYKDFAANSVNLDTSHNFGRAWMLSLADAFRYSPELANELGGAFSPDFQSGTSTNTAFLALQRKYWANAANINLDHQLSQQSHLIFDLSDDFVRFSGSSRQLVPETAPGFNQENAYSAGVKWSREWNRNNTLRLSYNFRRQEVPNISGDSNFHTINVGYTRILKPTLTLTMEAGPGFWSGRAIGGSNVEHRTTAQGSVSLTKSFRGGGIAFAAIRSANYSGVISNSLNNRYDVSINRQFFRKWKATATASYLQQEFVGKPSTKGELLWGDVAFRMTRMWSLFGGYRYYHTTALTAAPQHFVSLGLRWAWEPELKHQ
jgi:hypothetical protein